MVIVLHAGLLVFLLQLRYVEAIECYMCDNSTVVSRCSAVVSCSQGEVCYAEHVQTKNGTMVSLGCRLEAACTTIVSLSSTNSSISGSLVGRDATGSNCSECCRLNRCNKQLCQGSYSMEACSDSGAFDCVTAGDMLDVCHDIAHAQTVCRRFCGLCDYKDGSWSKWEQWSSCDVTCGNGSQSRQRQCTDPAPSGGGNDCVGDSNQIQTCVVGPCPVHGAWSLWQPWDSCSSSCGVGMQRRDRTCSNPYPALFGDHCFGDSRDDKICMERACTDGGWSPWGAWSSCGRTCGDGIQSRSRACNNPFPSLGGNYCPGDPYQVQSCNDRSCPELDGGWGDWSPWTLCTVTCNTGLKTRHRMCDNPKPSSGGTYCQGLQSETALCNQHQCNKQDGGWSEWSAWTSCTATCGTGLRSRQRTCDNPEPSGGGEYCPGTPLETSLCSQQHCSRQRSSFTAINAAMLSSGVLNYKQILLNEGSDFDNVTGTFTCRVPGLYMFVATVIEISAAENDIFCYIRNSGHNSIPLRSSTMKYYADATAAAAWHLAAGDTVNVWCSKGNSTHSSSSFTGSLIAEDP